MNDLTAIMMRPDTINGLFELFAVFFVLNHCRVLYAQKEVRGVSVVSAVFFTLWGYWNMYYYPYLGQMFSFYCGVLVCLANMTWVSMMLYYRRQELHYREEAAAEGRANHILKESERIARTAWLDAYFDAVMCTCTNEEEARHWVYNVISNKLFGHSMDCKQVVLLPNVLAELIYSVDSGLLGKHHSCMVFERLWSGMHSDLHTAISDIVNRVPDKPSWGWR